MKTNELLQQEATLYILHPSGKYEKGSPVMCNKFTINVQPDYGRGITSEDAVAFAQEIKRKVNTYNEVVSALNELVDQVAAKCPVGSDPALIPLFQAFQKAKKALQKP